MSRITLALSGVLAATVLALVLIQFWPDLRPGSRGGQASDRFGSRTERTAQLSEAINPIPLTVATDPRKVALGNRLFHEPKLSINETISCAFCHDLAKGGADGRRNASGVDNSIGTRNTPTVLNSGFNVAQFWDGRARTLEEQVDGPVHDLVEMGSNWPLILERLRHDASYATAFRAIYGDGVQIANVKNAIAEFERSLITPNSPFDRYLRGEAAALTAEEIRGYQLFKNLGCISCHQGVNIGGNLFQRLGVIVDYIDEHGGRGKAGIAHFGRFNVTGLEEDKFVFKVPSLRNVDLTAPYLHDGSAADLKTVVKLMAWHQLGRRLEDKEVDGLVAFLKTLTGEQWDANR